MEDKERYTEEENEELHQKVEDRRATFRRELADRAKGKDTGSVEYRREAVQREDAAAKRRAEKNDQDDYHRQLVASQQQAARERSEQQVARSAEQKTANEYADRQRRLNTASRLQKYYESKRALGEDKKSHPTVAISRAEREDTIDRGYAPIVTKQATPGFFARAKERAAGAVRERQDEISAWQADAKRQWRQGQQQKAAVHSPSISERIKSRASGIKTAVAGIDFGGMLGGAVSTTTQAGSRAKQSVKNTAVRGKQAYSGLEASIDLRTGGVVSDIKPRAKARLKEVGQNMKANLVATGREVGRAYLAGAEHAPPKNKRTATVHSTPLDAMLGIPKPHRASFRGTGRGGGGFGDIGIIDFGGAGDITGLGDFGAGGGGGGGGGGHYNSPSGRNIYRPGAQLTCNSCGWTWTMRGTRRPRVCPHCKSYTWSRSNTRSSQPSGPSAPTDFLDPFGM